MTPDTRPAAWLPAATPPRQGLPPLRQIPDETRIGLSREQCRLLTEACSGRDLWAEGPAGSGKTTVLTRYAKLRAAQGDTAIFCASPDRKSPVASYSRLADAASVSTVIKEAKTAKAGGQMTCLIVDEHSSMTEELADEINAFDQLILTGDPAQGTYGAESDIVRKLAVSVGALRLETRTLWRSDNQEQFNTMNALVYQGRHEAIGWASEEGSDPMRATHGPHGAFATFTDVGLRAVRNAHAAPDATLGIVVATREEMCIVASVLAHARLPEPAPKIRFLHPTTLQGTEAHLILCATGSAALARSQQDIEALAFVLMGRAKHRLELRRPEAGSQAEGFDAWIAGLTSWRYEPVAADPLTAPYSGFAAEWATDCIIREGLTHLAVIDRATGAGQTFVNLAGESLRDASMRGATAGAKGWSVDTHHLEEMTPGLWKPSRREPRPKRASRLNQPRD